MSIRINYRAAYAQTQETIQALIREYEDEILDSLEGIESLKQYAQEDRDGSETYARTISAKRGEVAKLKEVIEALKTIIQPKEALPKVESKARPRSSQPLSIALDDILER